MKTTITWIVSCGYFNIALFAAFCGDLVGFAQRIKIFSRMFALKSLRRNMGLHLLICNPTFVEDLSKPLLSVTINSLIKVVWFLFIAGLRTERRGVQCNGIWRLPFSVSERSSDVLSSKLKCRNFPCGIYSFNVSTEDTRASCKFCSEFTPKIPKWHYWRRSGGVFIFNFEKV